MHARGEHPTPYTQKWDMRVIVSTGLFLFGKSMNKVEINKLHSSIANQ